MRIALIADIHGNLPALQAVLDDLDQNQTDQIICLGDVGTMGPFPFETLEQVHDLGCPVVMGNGDAAMLQPPAELSEDVTTRRFEEMDRWCTEQLSSAHLDFIGSFVPTYEIVISEDQTLLCFHGSPRSYNDVISATTPDDELEPMLDDFRATVMAGGHSHFQMLRRYRDMTLCNPGSTGLAYEFDDAGQVFIPSHAEYGLVAIENGCLSLEHRRIPYDSSITVRAMHDRDFPHAEWWAANWRHRTDG